MARDTIPLGGSPRTRGARGPWQPDEGDCDEADPGAYPGGLEIPYDGVDQDCDGADVVDVDEDGYVAGVTGGDGFDDFLAGAYRTGGDDEFGAAYLVYGRER